MIEHPDKLYTTKIVSQFSYEVWEKQTEETELSGEM